MQCQLCCTFHPIDNFALISTDNYVIVILGSGNYNYGNPGYMLLVGACKRGIEPLVRALLQVPGVAPLLAVPIPSHNGLNVAELAKQNGHISIANCINDLIHQ